MPAARTNRAHAASTDHHPAANAIRSATPAGMIPKVRRPDFIFPDDAPQWWWGHDPFRTLLLAALSAGFPPGERFFIDSVRHFQDRITDPELREAIRGFIGQEAHHSREHQGLNTFLESRGIPVSAVEADIARLMDRLRANLSPERQLAHTVAVEHFTALMAEEFLLKYDVLDDMDPRLAPLWAWHAIEESEHKAVAFDVYKAIGGSEFVRLSEMMIVSVLFPLFTMVHLLQLMKATGELGNVKSLLGGLNFLWGKPGVFRKMLPAYLKFYSPRFHPWNHDARSLISKAKEKYLGHWV